MSRAESALRWCWWLRCRWCWWRGWVRVSSGMLCGCSTARGGWKRPPRSLFPKLTRFRCWNSAPRAAGARTVLFSSPCIRSTCGVGSAEEWETSDPKSLDLVAMVKAGHPTGLFSPYKLPLKHSLWTAELSKPISVSQLLIHSGGILFPFRHNARIETA